MAHHTRPWIGINADFIPAGKLTSSHVRLNAGYFDAILAAHGLPVIMPPFGKEAEINAFLDRLDGFVAAIVLAGILGFLRGGVDGVGRGLVVW